MAEDPLEELRDKSQVLEGRVLVAGGGAMFLTATMMLFAHLSTLL